MMSMNVNKRNEQREAYICNQRPSLSPIVPEEAVTRLNFGIWLDGILNPDTLIGYLVTCFEATYPLWMKGCEKEEDNI